MRRRIRALTVTALGALVAGLTQVAVTAPAAHAALSPDDYCGAQCSDILPPGEQGSATLAEILAHKLLGTRPAHSADQLGKYASLAGGYKTLTTGAINQYFNDASFGVPADQVASTIKPRADVTIVRDKALGVPHITGTTRAGTEFGAGYAAAQDRLWLMDVLRH
ncbi:penicillin acylase family protein, partial [Amycolatopsis sp.]|uniref:penicillin acylase family protein n=1 Tax=Amycolatopsis sp. TaxID=37632 RepID=UPI002D7EA10A